MAQVFSEVIEPLIPECVGGRLDGDFNNQSALDFDPTVWSYYKTAVLPSAIAGGVFAIISLLLCFFVIGWIIAYYCPCCFRCFSRSKCCKGKQKQATTAIPADQFIVSKSSQAPQQATIAEDNPPELGQQLSAAEKGTSRETTQPDEKLKENESSKNKTAPSKSIIQGLKASFASQSNVPRKTRILNWLIALFGLTTVALCIWGIPESLTQTATQIDTFWDLVDGVYDALDATVAELQILSSQLIILDSSVQQINTETDKLTPLVANLGGVVGDTLTQALGLLDTAADSVTTVSSAIESAVNSLETYLGANLNDFEAKFKPPTTNFQIQGRVAAIVVILSVILVCAIVSTILCWKMRYPAAASYLNAVLFFFIFLVFLIGTSVVRAMVTLANDGCLYAETFVTTTLLNTINNPAEQIWLKRALDFYLNPNAPSESTGQSALSEVAGINIVPVLDAIQSPVVESVLGVLDTGIVQTALNFVLQDATVKAINDLADIIQPLGGTIGNIDGLMSRNTTYPLYYGAKELICCDGANAAQRLFECWTSIAAIATAFTVLCVWRVMSHTWDKKKEASKSSENAAVVPAETEDEIIVAQEQAPAAPSPSGVQVSE